MADEQIVLPAAPQVEVLPRQRRWRPARAAAASAKAATQAKTATPATGVPEDAQGTDARIQLSTGARVWLSVRRSGAGAIASAYLSFQAMLLAIAFLLGTATDGPSIVIIGSSMTPGLPPGSVTINERPQPSRIGQGAIIAFTRDGRTVSHRVVGLNNGTEYITRGDANSASDSTPVRIGEILGVARVIVPYVGLPQYWFINGNYLRLGAWLITVIAACLALTTNPKPS